MTKVASMEPIKRFRVIKIWFWSMMLAAFRTISLALPYRGKPAATYFTLFSFLLHAYHPLFLVRLSLPNKPYARHPRSDDNASNECRQCLSYRYMPNAYSPLFSMTWMSSSGEQVFTIRLPVHVPCVPFNPFITFIPIPAPWLSDSHARRFTE